MEPVVDFEALAEEGASLLFQQREKLQIMGGKSIPETIWSFVYLVIYMWST